MKRVFVTSISLQGRGDLKKVVYHPVDFSLKKEMKTSFPIISIIAREIDNTNIENIEVIAIRAEHNDTRDNFQVFLEELRELGIKEDQVVEHVITGNQGKKDSIRMLLTLLDIISDDSIVFGDITYNTKPMSAMILYAMQLVEKMKDVEVEGIFYGEIPRTGGVSDDENAKLYDLTSFKYLLDVVLELESLGVSDIRQTIERMVER